jgi:hypothetical protein
LTSFVSPLLGQVKLSGPCDCKSAQALAMQSWSSRLVSEPLPRLRADTSELVLVVARMPRISWWCRHLKRQAQMRVSAYQSLLYDKSRYLGATKVHGS